MSISAQRKSFAKHPEKGTWRRGQLDFIIEPKPVKGRRDKKPSVPGGQVERGLTGVLRTPYIFGRKIINEGCKEPSINGNDGF